MFLTFALSMLANGFDRLNTESVVEAAPRLVNSNDEMKPSFEQDTFGLMNEPGGTKAFSEK